MRDAAIAYKAYQDVRFFGGLDGVRALCILAVLWHHAPLHDLMGTAPQLVRRGFLGVNFFFVLSGFLITTLLLREEARNGRFSLRGFYWRRALRIIPVYFLVVTASVVYFVGIKGQTELAGTIPYYYLFFSNMLTDHIPLLFPTWSLSVEEQYYMIWPMLLLAIPALGRARFWVLLGLIGICVLSAAGHLSFLGLRPVETDLAVWKLSATGYSAILMGSVVAWLLHQPKSFERLYNFFGHIWMPVAAFLVLAAVMQWLPEALWGWPDFLIHICMAICLISIVIREDHLLMPVLRLGWLVRLGQISYGLYLYHLIGLHIGNKLAVVFGLNGIAHLWVVTLIYAAASILIAEISFRTFERYFLSLKDKPHQAASA